MRPIVAACDFGLGRFLRSVGRLEYADRLTASARLFAEMGLTVPQPLPGSISGHSTDAIIR